MNTATLVFSLLLAVSQAASVVPIDSSSVSIKHSGQDYSYTIHDNRGIVIDPSATVHQQAPTAKAVQIPVAGSILLNQIGQKAIEHDQKQFHPHQIHPQIPASIQTRLKGENNLVNIIVPVELLPPIQFDPNYPYSPFYPYYPNLIPIVQ